MRHRARRQSSPRVIRVGPAFRRVVGLKDLRQPALDIVLAGQPQRARAAVGRNVAALTFPFFAQSRRKSAD